MSCEIEAASPEGPLWRVGRRPDAWAWLDWSFAGPDGTFGNRFDDPDSEFRVLYANSTRFGAYVEVLARYRPDPAVAAGLAEIEAEFDDESEVSGTLPEDWVERRIIGSAESTSSFAAIGQARSLAYLRETLADRVLHYGVYELDAAAIRMTVPRALTQEISRHVSQCGDGSGGPQFAGITYLSRLGDELRNWALFESPEGSRPLESESNEPVEVDDPDLQAALQHLNLTLG